MTIDFDSNKLPLTTSSLPNEAESRLLLASDANPAWTHSGDLHYRLGSAQSARRNTAHQGSLRGNLSGACLSKAIGLSHPSAERTCT
jgi:hypothetical protein